MGHTKCFGRVVVAALALALSAGCAGSIKNMREALPDYAPKPEPGKAMLVFMRPSGMGFAVQSSVFEIKDNTPVLAGIVAAKAKVAHQVEPGNRLFMVVGESGDFLSADLVAGKTYFALVTPRMGAWKARFSLAAVHAADLSGAEFNGWFNDCRWVEKSQESAVWFQENLPDITTKYVEYYPKWMGKAEADRPKLVAGDGK